MTALCPKIDTILLLQYPLPYLLPLLAERVDVERLGHDDGRLARGRLQTGLFISILDVRMEKPGILRFQAHHVYVVKVAVRFYSV